VSGVASDEGNYHGTRFVGHLKHSVCSWDCAKVTAGIFSLVVILLLTNP
jgi:hypothetical protein